MIASAVAASAFDASPATVADPRTTHAVEHMVFKGTAGRDVHRTNRYAECLGAEVNALTNKDHTAYDIRGRGAHATDFVHMLAEIVQHATFPEAGSWRASARCCCRRPSKWPTIPWTPPTSSLTTPAGALHPPAPAVIGPRGNIERLQQRGIGISNALSTGT